jgi:hypothetical protein
VRTFAITLLALLACASPASAAWTRARTLPDSTGVGALPRVAMGLNGTVAVAFVRDGVRVAVRRAGGQIAPTTLVSSARRAVSSPAIAISGRGDIIVVWIQARSSRLPVEAPYQVRAVAYDPGHGWGRPRVFGETPYFDTAKPVISVNARGDAAIGWRCVRETSIGAQNDAICVTARRSGHKFGPVHQISDNRATTAVKDHQVVIGPKGGVHVAWTRLPGPVVRYTYRNVSNRWDRISRLSAAPGSRPKMAATADGAVVIAWHAALDDRDSSTVPYGPLWTRVRSRSGKFSPALQVSSVPIYEPEIAAGPTGEVLIEWSTPRGVEPALPDWNDVHWVLRPAGAFRVAYEQRAAGMVDGSPSFAPTGRLGYLSSGQALLALGGPGGLRVTTRVPGGGFSVPELVDRAGDLPILVTRRTHAAVVYVVTDRQGEARLLIRVRRG